MCAALLLGTPRTAASVGSASGQTGRNAPIATIAADSTLLVRTARERIASFITLWRAEFVAAYADTSNWSVTRAAFRTERGRVVAGSDSTANAAFLEFERTAWPHRVTGRNMETPYARCMKDGFPWSQLGALSPVVTRIASRASIRGYCPRWSSVLDLPDMHVVIDSALPLPQRDRVLRERVSLIGLLDSTAREIPGDAFVVGQLVRMTVVQGDLAHADRAATACQAAKWWCAMLRGYVLARRDSLRQAAQAFSAVDESLTPVDRCQWNNIGPLLDAPGRAVYESAPCARQALYNVQFWWLSDPLWSDTVNERKIEHAVRRVRILLHSALDRDEFFSWSPSLGGDAAREMLVRYGWPSFMSYGAIIQAANDRMLEDAKEEPSGPYAMPQYHRSRVHTTPTWEALTSPTLSIASDWTLHEPDTLAKDGDVTLPIRTWDARGFQRLRLEPERLKLVLPHSVLWWPAEHFEPHRPLVDADLPQIAQLRRMDSVLLAMSTSAKDPLAKPDAAFGYSPLEIQRWRTDSLRVTMVGGSGPENSGVLAAAVVPVGRTVALHAMVSAGEYVLGMEARALSPNGPDARVRLGVTTARPLSELAPGEIAISDPILLRASRDDRTASQAVDILPELQRMLPSSIVNRAERLDLVWEVYGVRASDTLDVEIRLIKDGRTGVLYRIASRIGVIGESADSVTVRWRDAGGTRALGNTTGSQSNAVPILIGQLRWNPSNQTPGWYTLETAVTDRNGRTVVGRRRLRIVE